MKYLRFSSIGWLCFSFICLALALYHTLNKGTYSAWWFYLAWVASLLFFAFRFRQLKRINSPKQPNTSEK